MQMSQKSAEQKNPLSRPRQKGCGNWDVVEVCVLGQANLMDFSADGKMQVEVKIKIDTSSKALGTVPATQCMLDKCELLLISSRDSIK